MCGNKVYFEYFTNLKVICLYFSRMSHVPKYTSRTCIYFLLTIGIDMIVSLEVFLSVVQRSSRVLFMRSVAMESHVMPIIIKW